jgi:uncharacterized protein YqjF (DUF2071 family)
MSAAGPHASPARRIFLTAEWRHLLMLNYGIDPELLKPHVPPGTELDSFAGRTYVSMVGFMFLNTRVLGLRVPLHQNFEEVNLRFYVRRQTPNGMRRGVVFIREIVPRWAIATVARVFYNENYASMPMRHTVVLQSGALGAGSEIEYGWRHHAQWNSLSAKLSGAPAFVREGSLEQFITEHYWGYSRQRDGGCVEYEVAHPRWRVWPVAASALTCDSARIYGDGFVNCLSAQPESAFVADGSEVEVCKGTRLA